MRAGVVEGVEMGSCRNSALVLGGHIPWGCAALPFSSLFATSTFCCTKASWTSNRCQEPPKLGKFCRRERELLKGLIGELARFHATQCWNLAASAAGAGALPVSLNALRGWWCSRTKAGEKNDRN